MGFIHTKWHKRKQLVFHQVESQGIFDAAWHLVISELRVTTAYHGIILPLKCHQRTATKKRYHRLSFDCRCNCGNLNYTAAVMTLRLEPKLSTWSIFPNVYSQKPNNGSNNVHSLTTFNCKLSFEIKLLTF